MKTKQSKLHVDGSHPLLAEPSKRLAWELLCVILFSHSVFVSLQWKGVPDGISFKSKSLYWTNCRPDSTNEPKSFKGLLFVESRHKDTEGASKYCLKELSSQLQRIMKKKNSSFGIKSKNKIIKICLEIQARHFTWNSSCLLLTSNEDDLGHLLLPPF